jgi:mono/diheme cytochrome c family protein
MSVHECKTCGRQTRPKHSTPADFPGMVRRVGENCQTCHQRLRRGGAPALVVQRPKADLIEDAEWMAQGGECLAGAVARSGISHDYFVHVLTEAGRTDILRRLRARDLVAA